MLKQDLKTAGIPYVDENGLYADFHALRHTFITNMVKAGVNPKTAQSLARHSTIDLTMNVYTYLTVSDQASALESLPAVPNLEQKVGQEKVPAMVPRGAENGAKRLTSEASKFAPDCTEETPDEDAGTPKPVGSSGVISRQKRKRRGGDSNPRWVAPHWFSRPAQSATLSPLRQNCRTQRISCEMSSFQCMRNSRYHGVFQRKHVSLDTEEESLIHRRQPL